MMTVFKHLVVLSVAGLSVGCTSSNGDGTGSVASDPMTGGLDTDSTTGEETTTGTPTTAGPDTGAVTTGDSDEPCIETQSVLALDDPTPLGASAAVLLEGKLGPRSATLFFVAGFIYALSDDWSEKKLGLSVDLRYEGGEIRWIGSEANPNWDGKDIECFDRLEIDAEIDFVTETGEFDEDRPALVMATEADRIVVVAEFLPPGLSGSLDVSAIYADPDWVIVSLGFLGVWQGADAGGRVLHRAVNGNLSFSGKLAGWGNEDLLMCPLCQQEQQ